MIGGGRDRVALCGTCMAASHGGGAQATGHKALNEIVAGAFGRKGRNLIPSRRIPIFREGDGAKTCTVSVIGDCITRVSDFILLSEQRFLIIS